MLNNTRVVKKTLVDSTNTLWDLEYDVSDNTVEILSEYTDTGSAFLSQYSLDNALGHDIPNAVLSSAEQMLGDDDDYASLSSIIDTHAFDNMFESP